MEGNFLEYLRLLGIPEDHLSTTAEAIKQISLSTGSNPKHVAEQVANLRKKDFMEDLSSAANIKTSFINEEARKNTIAKYMTERRKQGWSERRIKRDLKSRFNIELK
jgi:hypothetical protein